MQAFRSLKMVDLKHAGCEGGGLGPRGEQRMLQPPTYCVFDCACVSAHLVISLAVVVCCKHSNLPLNWVTTRQCTGSQAHPST